MQRIQFSITYPDPLVHPLHRQLMEGTSISRAELLMWSPTEDATTLLWCDSDRDETEQVITAIDSLRLYNVMEDNDGTYTFLQQDDYEFSPAMLDAIAGAQVIFLPPVVFLENGAVRFEAVGGATALSQFHDKLSEFGDLTIEHVYEFERQGSPSQLTDRQRVALESAVAAGYYEVPRDGSIKDITTSLDCSPSTAGELIRKAESAVIQGYTETKTNGGN